MDNAPSIPQMRREIRDEQIRLESRSPPASSYEVVDMLDSKLTNYISDLKKTDPHYEKKIRYFKGLLSSGMVPNAKETFRRKGHGKVDVAVPNTPEQEGQERTLPPYVSNGGKKKKTLKRRHHKTRKTRR